MKIGGITEETGSVKAGGTFSLNDNVIQSLMRQKAQLQQSLSEVETNKKLTAAEIANRVKDITQQLSDLDQRIAAARQAEMAKTAERNPTGKDSSNADNNGASTASGTISANSAAAICTVSTSLQQTATVAAVQRKSKDRLQTVNSNIKLDSLSGTIPIRQETAEAATLTGRLAATSADIGERLNDIAKAASKIAAGDDQDGSEATKTDAAEAAKKKAKSRGQARITNTNSNQTATTASRKPAAGLRNIDVQA